MKLYHYTCTDHGQAGIEPGGMLLPNHHPWLPFPLIWVTDLDVPHREALGLTSYSLSCDRTKIRYEVHPNLIGNCIPWVKYAQKLPPEVRETLESAPGTMPRHWWVAEQPLLVLLPGRAA